MPDIEEEELALIYEAKGLPRDRARETAHAMMLDPVQALDAKVREELNIREADLSPLTDGTVTGIATRSAHSSRSCRSCCCRPGRRSGSR